MPPVERLEGVQMGSQRGSFYHVGLEAAVDLVVAGDEAVEAKGLPRVHLRQIWSHNCKTSID